MIPVHSNAAFGALFIATPGAIYDCGFGVLVLSSAQQASLWRSARGCSAIHSRRVRWCYPRSMARITANHGADATANELKHARR
jgi:hypothetical protein